MRGPSPAPELIDRFRRDIGRLTDDASGLGIAVSGGPDSLALLLLAAASCDGVEAATVDHRLRAEGAAEAVSVAGLCARIGVPHRILPAETPLTGNVQAEARALRYRLLGAWAQERGLRWIATAHHADDQAETLLMRLNRGAGLSGIAGIRRSGPLPHADGDLRLIRPLLDWRRSELEATVAAAGLDAAADPSNSDDRYDRSRIRKLLAATPDLHPESLARSAAALAEAEEALEWTARRLSEERIREGNGQFWFDPSSLPPELRRRLLLNALQCSGLAEAPRGDAVQRLLATLDEGGIATLGGVKCTGGETWRFEPAPPRRS